MADREQILREYETIQESLKRSTEYTTSEAMNAITATGAGVRLERINDLWKQFNDSHRSLMRVTVDEERPQFQETFNESEDQYIDAVSVLKDKQVALSVPPTLAQAAPLNAEAPVFKLTMPTEQGNIANTWGTFSGNLLEWKTFRDRFIARIHSKPETEIATSYKINYLTSSLTGKANAAIGGWSAENGGYEQIWKRLNDLYNERYPLAREFLKEFFQLRQLQVKPSASELSKLSNVTNTMLRTLGSENFPVEHWDMIVVHQLHGLLDEETARQWELLRGKEMPTAVQMLEFIDKQAKAAASAERSVKEQTKEHMSKPQKNNPVNRTNQSQANKVNAGASGSGFSAPRPPCESCSSPKHGTFQCPDYLSLSLKGREDFVKRRKLCWNCLQSSHSVAQCPDPRSCNLRECSGDNRHNSTLCPQKVGGGATMQSAVVVAQSNTQAAKITQRRPTRSSSKSSQRSEK